MSWWIEQMETRGEELASSKRVILMTMTSTDYPSKDIQLRGATLLEPYHHLQLQCYREYESRHWIPHGT